MNFKALFMCACFLACQLAHAEGITSPLQASTNLVQRVAPAMLPFIELEIIPTADGKDVYELESMGGKVVLRGNNGVSIASALNQYLQDYCKCEYSLWGDQMALPDPLPTLPEKIRVVNERTYRHFFNYCTFNYSGSWWDWDHWQRVIDFLAMNGVNMPLQIVGTEAVWYYSLLELGLTDLEAREFIAAPIYLNWQWMSNLEGSKGPMPKSWIDNHLVLGKQIIERQQALGMKPIVHGFSGHVPRLFQEKYPTARIDIKDAWAAGSFTGAAQLDPTDPLFETVGLVYLRKQIELMGNSHFYMADPFHEGTPPVEGDEYMQNVGQAISTLFTKADPEAIWIMQNWTAREQIVKAVAKDRLILMDLNGSKWNGHKTWGYKFTVGQLNNFGGRTYMHGDLQHQADNTFNMAKAVTEDCVGNGLWMEGIEDNPANYHLALNMNWKDEAVNLDSWLDNWTERRYGADSDSAKAAWHLLARGPYTKGGYGYSSMIAARPTLYPQQSGPGKDLDIFYDLSEMVNAWELLLADRDTLKNSPGYQYDIVDIGRQTLANLAFFYQRDMASAFVAKDKPRYVASAQKFFDLFDDMDELLASNEHFLLGKWLEDARNWGTTPDEQEYYAQCAATLVTIWGSDTPDPTLFDYAWREWSGLVKGFYKARWQVFYDEMILKLDNNETYSDAPIRYWGRQAFRGDAVLSKVADFEVAFANNPPSDLPSTATGDAAEISAAMYQKYAAIVLALPPGNPGDVARVIPDFDLTMLDDDLSTGYTAGPIDGQNGWSNTGAGITWIGINDIPSPIFGHLGCMRREGSNGSTGVATKNVDVQTSGENGLIFNISGHFRANFTKARYSLLNSTGDILLQLGVNSSDWSISTNGTTELLLPSSSLADINDELLVPAGRTFDVSIEYNEKTGLGILKVNKTNEEGAYSKNIVSIAGTFNAALEIDDIAAVQFSGDVQSYDQLIGVQIGAITEMDITYDGEPTILLRDNISASEGYGPDATDINGMEGWTTSGAGLEWRQWDVETLLFIPDGRLRRFGSAGVGVATKNLTATATGENLLTFKSNGHFRGNFSKARYSLLNSSGEILLQMGCYGSSWSVNTDGSTDLLTPVTPVDTDDLLNTSSGAFWDISLRYDDLTGEGSLWVNKIGTGTVTSPTTDTVSQVGLFNASFDIDDVAAVQFSGEVPNYDQANGFEVAVINNLDIDRDGIPNRFEYAFGGDPLDPNIQGTLPRLAQGAAGMEHIYLLRDDPSLTLTTLTSTNLMSDIWDIQEVRTGAIGVLDVETGLPGTNTFTLYTNNLPVAEQLLFIKLLIE